MAKRSEIKSIGERLGRNFHNKKTHLTKSAVGRSALHGRSLTKNQKVKAKKVKEIRYARRR